MTRVEQLHYCWTPRGVEGTNRFQIAAMSAGLRSGPMAVMLPVIKKICRYDRARQLGEAPISYGWFDYRDARVSFCRRPLETTNGRRGDFAAHILIGSAAAMPEETLAKLFESPFWWDGTPRATEAQARGKRWEFMLPGVDLADVPRATDPIALETSTVEALAQTMLLLPKHARLAVAQESYSFGRHVRAVAESYPEALIGISLSTYEGTPTFPFQVVGGLATQPGRTRFDPRSASLEPLAQATLTRLRTEPSLRTAAWALAGGNRSDADRGVFLECAERVVAVASTGSESGDVELSDILAIPEAVNYIAGEAAGRTTLARALSRGAAAGSVAVTTAAKRMSHEQLHGLARATADSYGSGHALHGCAHVAEQLESWCRGARATVLEACLHAALADVEKLEGLSGRDLHALLLQAAPRRSANEVLPLLARALPRAADLADDRRIPDGYVLAMALAIIPRAHEDRGLVQILEGRRGLLDTSSLSVEDQERSLAWLEKLPPATRAACLTALLPAVLTSATQQRVANVLASMPPGAAARVLLDCKDRVSASAAPALGELCADTAAAVLERDFSSAHVCRSSSTKLACQLLAAGKGDDGSRARHLLSSLGRRSHLNPREVLAAATDIAHPRLRAAVITIALLQAVERLSQLADVESVWEALRSVEPDAPAELLVIRLLQQAVGATEWSGELVLGWLALRQLPRTNGLLSRSGKLQPPELQRLSLTLATRIGPGRFEFWQDSLADCDKWIRAWWGGLETHARRQAHGSRLTRPLRLALHR
jgi:GTPase-associated protein 1, N-terminal domain type 2